MKIHIQLLKPDFSRGRLAMEVAEKFEVDYPLRVGSYHGVGYRYGEITLYAYRTSTGTIVVREI
jgi:hypothetical protein